MLKTYKKGLLLRVIFCSILLSSCSEQSDKQLVATPKIETSTVADDVLFLVLGKMSLYDQNTNGTLTLRNHHFVAEIMPKKGRKIVAGTLTSALDPDKILIFNSEGIAFLAHGERVRDPEKLHEIHPDGAYLFNYETESGFMRDQRLLLSKRSTIEQMPNAERVTLSQQGRGVSLDSIDPEEDLLLSWDSMSGNTKVASSELADLIFVLGFDCFGNNIAHSGRPFQGGRYLTYRDTDYVITASSLKAGLNYTAIVEQATADVVTYQGVPGISTYATLTFVKFRTSGKAEEGKDCPVSNKSD